MNGPLAERLSRERDERRSQGLLRALPGHQTLAVDLSTNSYRALHLNDEVAAEARRLAGPRLHGNLASRLISEISPLAAELEAELAAWKKTEAALLFNSGYAANVGVLQAIAGPDTEFFCDRLNHASIIDGLRLSGRPFSRYRHGDMADLKRRLAASNAREKVIVTDTVFSMDGDCAPLIDIAELAGRYGCSVMADEAHAAGVFGKSGSGLVEELGVSTAIDISIGTLSKAIAGVGGFFAGSALLRDHLVNHARSLIYSTGLPHAAIAFDLSALRYLRAHTQEGRRLLDRADRFREQLHGLGFDTLSSTTQIVPCLTGGATEATALAAFLRKRGILAPAVRPPAVPRGSARVRFSLHSGFSTDQEETVIAALREWKNTHG